MREYTEKKPSEFLILTKNSNSRREAHNMNSPQENSELNSSLSFPKMLPLHCVPLQHFGNPALFIIHYIFYIFRETISFSFSRSLTYSSFKLLLYITAAG